MKFSWRIPDDISAGRLQSVDFLRGVAALAVVVNHALAYADYTKVDALWFQGLAAVMSRGHLGVPLFFVLSGFCIHANTAKRAAAGEPVGIDFVPFWRRRLRRLYPTYFVVLCCTMAMVVGLYFVGVQAAVVTRYPDPRLPWIGADFLAHVTMLHGFHPVFDQGGGDPPMWTLAREEYLYVLYMPLVMLRRRLSMPVLTSLVLLIGVLFYFVSLWLVGVESSWWGIFRNSALVLWFQWVVGALAVEQRFGLVRTPRVLQHPGWIVVAVVLALGADAWLDWLEPIAWGTAFYLLLCFCVRIELARGWPTNRLVRWFCRVGIFSYSLYLIHEPVRGVLKQVVDRSGQTTNPFVYLLNVAIFCVAGYVAGRVLFSLVEVRFLRRRPRETRPTTRDVQLVPAER